MYEVNSLSLLVGAGICNANCPHCAGRIHRKYAPKEDGVLDEELIRKTLLDCGHSGAKYLSLSGSGEPTLSPQTVTRVLEIVKECRADGVNYFPINLYTNGIRIGEEVSFCNKYLPLWKSLGLTTMYVTVHSVDEKRNAEIIGISVFPNLKSIFDRIHTSGLLVRANLVLSKKSVSTAVGFVLAVNRLKLLGADYIAAWPVRDAEGSKADKVLSPDSSELDKIDSWLLHSSPYINIKMLRQDSNVYYKNTKKLTLFPDGSLTDSWCN